MKSVGCTTPFGLNLDSICLNSNQSLLADSLFMDIINEIKIEECLYPCNFLRIGITPWVLKTIQKTGTVGI